MENDMSMTMLTVFQITGVSAAYLGVTLFLPWLLLRRKLASLRAGAGFMVCFMAGNFYCMNLVFLLQLFHISNRVTLILGTLLPFLAAAVRKRKGTLAAVLEHRTRKVRMIFEGELGVRTFLLGLGVKMRRASAGWIGQWLAPRWPDVLLTLGIIGLVLFQYGSNTVNVYGYCASDMVLHNYWINHMEANRIFVDGVYPFGFHCVMYYLHEVFSVPVYVLLRVFALPQTLMIHLVLLAFLKLVCKSKYTPYVGTMAYIISGVFYQYTYFRYYAPLPQEYGMLFILPAAWFAIAFLREKEFGTGARGNLLLFSLCISMTLATHFYDTVAAGLFCIGIGAGFCFRCLRWRYLRRLFLAGVVGILIALLPMTAAYVTGTPLEGSLHWGMNMLSSGSKEETVQEEPGEEGSAVQENNDGEVVKDGPKKDSSVSWRKVLDCILGELKYYVTNDSMAAAKFMLGSVGVLTALGILWCVLCRPDYGAVLVSTGLFAGILCILQASAKLGLPQLIEVSRYSVYIGYGLAAVWSLCADGVVYLLFLERKGIHLGGIAALAASFGAIAMTGFRTPVRISAYETNDAITCLTNILRENGDSTSWTICSANDEQQMTWGKGYHYEVIDFLRDQKELKPDTTLMIPTDTVYFFIEKIPILYLDYINTIKPERRVSLEGAEIPLPEVKGLLPYIQDERWVTMSHMYYWAQAFRDLYPNEMEVYYETDAFVCYRVRQDGFGLYNFAVDYGYNR